MNERIISNIGNIATSIAILIITLILVYFVNRFLKFQIKKYTDILKVDPTNYQFLRHVIIVLIYIVGISILVYTIPQLKILATSLLAGAGVLAVAIGFASQQAFSNIISGIFIVIFKPFRINDRIKIGERYGVVEDISLRHTVIKDFENKRIIIPNSLISNEVITNSDYIEDKICKWIEVGISYESDLLLAKKIIKSEILKHDLHIDPRTDVQKNNRDQVVEIRVVQLAEYSVNIKAWAWAKDSRDGFIMSCDLNESIKLRFEKEGIEIPYPHRSLIYKG